MTDSPRTVKWTFLVRLFPQHLFGQERTLSLNGTNFKRKFSTCCRKKGRIKLEAKQKHEVQFHSSMQMQTKLC